MPCPTNRRQDFQVCISYFPILPFFHAIFISSWLLPDKKISRGFLRASCVVCLLAPLLHNGFAAPSKRGQEGHFDSRLGERQNVRRPSYDAIFTTGRAHMLAHWLQRPRRPPRFALIGTRQLWVSDTLAREIESIFSGGISVRRI